MDQIKVPKVSNTSIDASGKFFNPNWIGVNKKLNIKFRRKGNNT